MQVLLFIGQACAPAPCHWSPCLVALYFFIGHASELIFMQPGACLRSCILLSARRVRAFFHIGQAHVCAALYHVQALYPAICLKDAEVDVNFGSVRLKHVPPGFTPLATAGPQCTTGVCVCMCVFV
jgi:hypothetical protein